MAFDAMLYPLCKFDYDLMWLILQITPYLVTALVVYNGVKVIRDNEESRIEGKRGIKNAIIGFILILAFSFIGCSILPDCVPCAGDAHNAPVEPRTEMEQLNVWITEPADKESFNKVYDPTLKGVNITAKCHRRPAGSVIWSFNDPNARSETFTGGCGGVVHIYNESGFYPISATAVDDKGNKVTHKIWIYLTVTGIPP